MKKDTLKKLSKYGSLATATLVTGISEGAVDYTNIVDVNLNTVGSSYDIDIDGDGVMDFRAEVGSYATVYNLYGLRQLGSNQFVGFNSATTTSFSGWNSPVRDLSSGSSIGSSNFWDSYPGTGSIGLYNLGWYNPSNSNGYGPFLNDNKFVGARFEISGNYHYGWIGLSLNALGGITIHDFAYEQCAGQPISAGATTGGASCTPPGQECTSAISVPCNGGEFTGTTVGETTQSELGCTTTNSGGGMKWFHFTGDGNTWVAEALSTAGQYDTKLWGGSGTCGALTCITGNDDFNGLLSRITINTTIGADYYVVLGGYSADEGNYNLSIKPNIGSYTADPDPVVACDNDLVQWIAPFVSTGAGVDSTVWQISTDGGATYFDLGFQSNEDTLDATVGVGADGYYVRGAAYYCGSVYEATNGALLNVNSPTTSTISASACSSYTSPSGQVWTSSNTYMDTIANSNGCDSVMTINLTINNNQTGTENISACGSYTWRNGTTYNSSISGVTYTEPGVAVGGCDSVYTLNLTINNNQTGTENISACGSYTWRNGTTYNSNISGVTYTEPGVATNGCDSVYTLNLTINNNETGTDVITACGSYTWRDGVIYTSSNNVATYTEPGVATNGCDSLYTLNLTITPGPSYTDVVTACETYTWRDGNIYTSSNNTATHVVAIGGGCDSVYTLNLTINNPETTTETITACDSYTWRDGNTYTSNNNIATYIEADAGTNGCDSIYTLDLIINNSQASTEVVTTCANSYTWAANGNTYSTDGMYMDTLMTSTNCDSIVTLDLTFDSFSQVSIDVDGCDSVIVFGNTYYVDAVVNDTSLSSQNCDSITIANITVNSSVSTQTVYSTCDPSYFVGGATQTSDGVYYDTYTAQNGCDSIVETTLTLNAGFTTYFFDEEICDGESIMLGGASQTIAGTYYDTIQSGGCDSLLVTELAVLPTSNSSITETVAFGSSYSFNGNTYNQTGTYTATVMGANGCDSTITLNLTVLPNSIGELSTNFKIYPNPTRGSVVLESDEILSNIRVVDTKGTVVVNKELNSIKEHVDLRDLDAGIYFYELIDREGNISRGKIIREK